MRACVRVSWVWSWVWVRCGRVLAMLIVVAVAAAGGERHGLGLRVVEGSGLLAAVVAGCRREL